MNRQQTATLGLTAALFLFCSFLTVRTYAQDTQPKPAPTMPAGMKGADARDPRSKLGPGMYDASEAAMGIKHLLLLKKPDLFQLGTNDPDAPKVKETLGSIGIADVLTMPVPDRMALAQLTFANSDIAFRGDHLFMGNFYGVNIYNIADPMKARLVTSLLCPGGQGDVSVHENLLFMSVEMPNGRLDCSMQGFPAEPVPSPGQPAEPGPPAAQKDRFRGVRIFDISDIRNPKQVAAIQTCRGSHTHTLVVPRNDKNNVYVYVSGTSYVRPSEELAGCSDRSPDEDKDTARFRIEVIKVPLAAPQKAQVVATPRIFGDPKTGAVSALDSGGSHATGGRAGATDQCHDITVYSALGLAAGACAGNGILLDIKDPVNPKRVAAVNDPNYAYWHSASFSNDGKKVVFTDEWGGGMAPRCRENDPNKWGANAIFRRSGNTLTFANYYKLPAAQTESENCVAHNGSLVPVPGRDIKVQAWYQGGISIMDFTDAENPMEIAYFDRGPIDPNMLVMGGYWSAYWYNGKIYASEMARGLDILELTPTKYLTQNEIDAAKTVRMTELNVQNQEMVAWPRRLVIAKAYIDQLERSKALPAEQIASLRQSIQKAEASPNELGKLKNQVSSLNKNYGINKSAADTERIKALAEVLNRPSL